MCMNFGNLKRYLKDGQRREDMINVPRIPTSVLVAEDEDSITEKNKKLAKTFLKVTLSEHDKVYHKGGYKEGDSCNFREALKRGDSADDLVAAEKKEGDIKVGFVKFKEDEKTGKKEIVGIEEAKRVKVEGKDDKTVEVAKIGDVGREGSENAEDWMPKSLAEHDERFHPAGYKDGDECKFRDEKMHADKADIVHPTDAQSGLTTDIDADDVAAYEVLSLPIYRGEWKDGRPVSLNDLERARCMLDAFMLKHPEVSSIHEDASWDLENALTRNPGWHRNSSSAQKAEVWSDDDVQVIVDDLLDTPDKDLYEMFDSFYPESHFSDETAEMDRIKAYVDAVRNAVNMALENDPEVWASEEDGSNTWAYKAQNGHIINMGSLAEAVRKHIGEATETVAKKTDSIERYLSVNV